ncbi:MAG: hypothetical protein WC534_01170 [Candidatus Paceibacterota bacterium]
MAILQVIIMIKKEILTKPGFIRITTQGVICWFSYFRDKFSEAGNHIMVVCGEIPDKPRVKNFDQIKEIGGRLIASNFEQEAINYGNIIDRFDLSGRETLINCIYFTSGNSMIRVIERPDQKFMVEHWGKIPRDPSFYKGDGISKIGGETITIYNGLDQKEFGPFGSGMFCNTIIKLSGQATLPQNIGVLLK